MQKTHLDNQINKLKELLENKTIVCIEHSGCSEEICKFNMANGSAFRLHATDLGFWVEETIGKSQKYNGFKVLFKDINHYIHFMDKPHIEIMFKNNLLKITIDNDKSFEAKITDPYELKILKHPKGKSLIKEAVKFGEIWSIVFSDANCPPELILSKEYF